MCSGSTATEVPRSEEQHKMRDTTNVVQATNETLNSLYVVLASLKGYSSSEGNRLVVAAIVALERVTQDLPKCLHAPDKARALQDQSTELHVLLDKLSDLQDAGTSRRREEETDVLRRIVNTLERMQNQILGEDKAVAVTAMAGAADEYEEDEEVEDDEDDDPFFIPLPSAIKMADVDKFFVLAQPLTTARTSSPFMIVMAPDSSSLNDDDSSMLATSHLSTRAGSRAEEELVQLRGAGLGAGGIPHDGEAPEADEQDINNAAPMSAEAASPGSAKAPALGPSGEQATPEALPQEDAELPDASGRVEGAAAAQAAAEPTPAGTNDKLNQFVDFLHGKRPGSNMFHEKMELNMEGCRKLADFVASTERVKALSLSRNYIGDEGLKILCEGLSTNRSVTALDLPENNITDAGVAQLARSLANHPSLTQLQLSNNSIGDMGAACLAELIRSSRNLSKLGLSNNNIGKAGCQALRDAITANPSLKHLQLLPGNPVEEKEAKALAKALKRNNSFSFRSFLMAK